MVSWLESVVVDVPKDAEMDEVQKGDLPAAGSPLFSLVTQLQLRNVMARQAPAWRSKWNLVTRSNVIIRMKDPAFSPYFQLTVYP